MKLCSWGVVSVVGAAVACASAPSHPSTADSSAPTTEPEATGTDDDHKPEQPSAAPHAHPASSESQEPATRGPGAKDHHHGDHFALDFSDVERYVQHFEGPKRDAWQKPEEVIRLLDVSPGHRIVDLGAGTGYFLPHLSRATQASGRVFGLDAEANMVKYLRRRIARENLTNVEAHVVPEDSPGDLRDIDRILIVNTWHHIPQRREYSSKLDTMLSGDGFVLVVDFDVDSPHGPPAHARIPPTQVMDELNAANLIPSILEETLPHQYAVLGVKSRR